MQKVLLSSLLILMFLASCKLIDDDTDDPGTTEPEEYTITLTKPNGGETIVEGSAYVISWTSNTTEKVYIAFSYDNELSWYLIADSIANTGVFEWFPVPGTISNQCKIKVTTVDKTASDISESNFSIVKNMTESIVLISPNGTEEIEAGTQFTIKWFSSEIDSVLLEYTADNGQHWNFIAVDTFNTGVYYWEPVPNTPSTLSRIRVRNAFGGSPSDMSDSTFTILPEPRIEVRKPNGGEIWTVGSSQRIEWYSENIRNIKIAYTTNNGADWFPITQTTASIGYYVWTDIPSHNSQLCKIRIYDADDEQPSDVSDEPFAITDPIIEEDITILAPNGGEDFEAGTVQNISWNSNGINLVKIELSTNSGGNWSVLADNLENTGGYQWQVGQQLNAPQSLIKISDASDGTPSDVSNGTFKISPIKSINVTYPTSGLVFRAGDPVTVTWESSGLEKINIRYTTTNGIGTLDEPPFYILVTNVANQGFYEITGGFSIPSDKYFIEVYYSEGDRQWSSKSGNFKVTEQVYPTITLKQPNGGEEFLTSDPLNSYSHEILWESTEIENVRIDYSLNGGATWVNIVQSTPSSGIYTWTMPEDVAFRSENARIKVSSVLDSSMYDMSDEVFAIHPQTKLVRVIFPNGGEIISPPKEIDDPVPAMVWHSAGVYEVRIELSLDNGGTWITLENNYPSTGIYAFPFIYPSSMNARIKITDVSTDAGSAPASDISDNVFGYNVVE